MTGSLHEVVPIGDTIVSGLGRIERLSGGLLRFWCYIEQDNGDGTPVENLVVVKIVAPESAIPDAILKMLRAIGAKATTIMPEIADVVH